MGHFTPGLSVAFVVRDVVLTFIPRSNRGLPKCRYSAGYDF